MQIFHFPTPELKALFKPGQKYFLLSCNKNLCVFVFLHVDLSNGANQTRSRIRSTAMGPSHITASFTSWVENQRASMN